jgi:hypothetical protein
VSYGVEVNDFCRAQLFTGQDSEKAPNLVKCCLADVVNPRRRQRTYLVAWTIIVTYLSMSVPTT